MVQSSASVSASKTTANPATPWDSNAIVANPITPSVSQIVVANPTTPSVSKAAVASATTLSVSASRSSPVPIKLSSETVTKSNRVRRAKRLIWRDIYAEVKSHRPWWKCCRRNEDEEDARVVLDQISGVAEPGEVTFLMGSSGAGKTTLLNILTQRARGLRIYGEVQVNSHVMKPNEMRRMSAYVPQEDVFVGSLTVKETLVLAARLRMGQKTSADERNKRINLVIQEMGLLSCLDTKIGCNYEKSISRGEKKRLSFACEILTDPPILFCDEPTSGLDSFMAFQVMRALKGLAKDGKTVVCSIHQPSSQVFDMADKLVLLVMGQIAYQGPIKEVEGFFQNCGMPVPQYVSVPDHFMKILSRSANSESEQDYKERTTRVLKNYRGSDYADHVHNETHKFESSSARARMRMEIKNADYSSSWWNQFIWLFWRGMKVVLRDPLVIRVRMVQCVLVSLVIGLLYFRSTFTKDTIANVRGMSFAVLRDMNMMFLMPCVYVFTEELHVVYREYQSAMYSPSAYFMGKQLADGIQYLILPTIYCSFVYWMAGLEYSVSQFLLFWLVALLQAIVSTSIGYAGACIFGSLPLAAFFVPMFSVPMMIFAGFFIDIESIPIYFKPLTYFSWYRYAFEANIVNTFGRHNETIAGCLKENATTGYGTCDGRTGPEMVTAWNIDANYFWVNILALVLIAISWRGIATFALWQRVRRH